MTEYDTSLPRKSHSSCTNRCEKGAGGHGELLGQIGLMARPTVALTCGNSLHRVTLGLFVGHGEDAVPIRRWLIEEVVLATFPVGAGGSVVRPLIENGLKGGLGVEPFAVLIERAGQAKAIEARLGVGSNRFAQT